MSEEKKNEIQVYEVNYPSAEELKESLKDLVEYQGQIKDHLIESHDYGVIPGLTKPSLFKPGAEKIFKLFHCRAHYIEDVESRVQDHDNGYFYFKFKCEAIYIPTGQVLDEGYGICNTKEKKYQNQNPYTLANTMIKMAEIRALRDTALSLGALSDIFTQDFDEEDQVSQDFFDDRKPLIDDIQKALAKSDASQGLKKKILAECFGAFTALEIAVLPVEKLKSGLKVLKKRLTGGSSFNTLTKDDIKEVVKFVEDEKINETELEEAVNEIGYSTLEDVKQEDKEKLLQIIDSIITEKGMQTESTGPDEETKKKVYKFWDKDIPVKPELQKVFCDSLRKRFYVVMKNELKFEDKDVKPHIAKLMGFKNVKPEDVHMTDIFLNADMLRKLNISFYQEHKIVLFG